jgi:transcription elongation GreA/GreB family factor
VSKAFTKDDEGPPPPPPKRRGIDVPDPNFVTPAGLAAARAELATADPDRAAELAAHLATAIETPPPADRGEVGLGAAVTVSDDDGRRRVFRIVGAIEADAKRGAVSFHSPIANALWGARVGESVALPTGDVEIVAIEY